MSKERLTVTVDPELIRAGNNEVADGRAGSLSAWVNVALADRAAKDRRLRALRGAVAAYEERFGVMSDDELGTQQRADRASARVVRGTGSGTARLRRSPRKGAA